MCFNFLITWYSLTFASICGITDAARILGVFTCSVPSHNTFHRALMQSLADVGHHITYVSPFPPPKEQKNFKFINSRPHRIDKAPLAFNFSGMSWRQILSIGMNMILEKDCYDFINAEEVQELLSSNEKYDVMFVEMMTMYECYLPVAKKFSIPVIGTLSTRTWPAVDYDLGNPHPLVFPFLFSSNPTRMSFYQRLQNFFDHAYLEFYRQFRAFPKLKKFYRIHFPDYDLSRDKDISFFFINWNPSMFPRATVPTVAEIGGVHIKPASPLPPDIQKFADEAQNGVILFTIGSFTSTSTLGPELKSVFVEAFAEIPQRVIWKFDDKIQNLSDNVLLSNWLPQRDILAHRNVKAFITHTGTHGTTEAIYEAKPMIMMPLYGDQVSSAAILEELGVGIRLTGNLTKGKLLDAIDKVLNDKRYSEKMKALSQRFKDRPMSPQEMVVYWTEYVIRYNGTRHLRPVAADMPLYSYLLLDILLFMLLCAAVITFVLYYLGKKIYIICFRMNRHILKNTKSD